MEWKPISEAPKGECIIAGSPKVDQAWIAQWRHATETMEGYWMAMTLHYAFKDPTHWMPLPEPPTDQE